ncbi:serine hydrolase domain-containing protein [Leekyejoonella antrihumi]|uniref:serine hydrolase domain-containing protein n=1 Tax=Leekyejoonella antrihumi TaxID=1660198 RepID=UPI001645372D|nr:serine hydrolase domain-containing protein [Leekyejoonella antrihumi]
MLSEVEVLLRNGVAARPRALFAGAVAQVAIRGRVMPPVVIGDAVRWADSEHELAPGRRVPMSADTVFDIASLTKVFTALVALRVLPRHGIRLDDSIADVLAEYAVAPRRAVTWRHLLTHTSGLPPTDEVWRLDLSAPARRARVLAAELQDAPGARQAYSCVGYITAGIALEALTGLSLGTLVAQEVTTPLALHSTRYRPPAEWASRIAATEFADHAGRGMIRGEVHDETARSIGGVSGNAGIFSTVGDLLTLGLELSGPRGTGWLDPKQWQLATTDQRPAGARGDYGQAIGMRVGDPGLLPGLDRWCGHTGFTGTSLVVEPGTGTAAVLLTNRVHPRRDWSDLGETRRAFTTIVARASASA